MTGAEHSQLAIAIDSINQLRNETQANFGQVRADINDVRRDVAGLRETQAAREQADSDAAASGASKRFVVTTVIAALGAFVMVASLVIGVVH